MTNNKKLGIIIPILCLFSISKTLFGDSPLTSIKFWDLSGNKKVNKIGMITEGKKVLNKRAFKFLVSSRNALSDKISMVNALGWGFDSKQENSIGFLKKLNTDIKMLDDYGNEMYHIDVIRDFANNENKSGSMNSLGMQYDLRLIYAYMKAMDHYSNFDTIQRIISTMNDLKTEINLEIEIADNPSEFEKKIRPFWESYNFIYMLLSAQSHTLAGMHEFCEVWESYFNYLTTDRSSYETPCFNDEFIMERNNRCYQYLQLYMHNCQTISYDLNYQCNLPDTLTINKNQELNIQHYPLFVYGDVVLSNRNDDIVWSKQINGDDYLSIDFQNLNNGLYSLKLLGKMKNNRDIDYSEAKDSDYSIVTYNIHLKVNE